MDFGEISDIKRVLRVDVAPGRPATVTEIPLQHTGRRLMRIDETLDGRPGSLLSLLPLGGRAGGIRTGGLRYPLNDEDLDPGTTRGVSNEFVASSARIQVRTGTLVAIQPDALEES